MLTCLVGNAIGQFAVTESLAFEMLTLISDFVLSSDFVLGRKCTDGARGLADAGAATAAAAGGGPAIRLLTTVHVSSIT